MPQRTNTYKMEYFKQGSFYGSLSDMRRFLTLDYNLESYIGLVGVGVIEGWTLEELTGLAVQVLPGNGIVNGYYMESPYVVKQRSDMVDGDREVFVLPDDGVPEPNLTAAQETEYIKVVRLYNPSFDPSSPIENAYVKVVVPTVLALSDNSDNYVFAEIRLYNPSSTPPYSPYPALADYPTVPGEPPDRGDYGTYDTYRVALDAYRATIALIHEYDWRNDSANHFTEVKFVVSSTSVPSSIQVLLGKVVTRNGSVYKIDTSGVDVLKDMQSQIERFGREFIISHHHGGTKAYDPPKIRLKTDIRNAVLKSYNEDNLNAVFSVLNNLETSITIGHKHTYEVDADGNGNTLDLIGSGNIHYHKIISMEVQVPEDSASFVESHTHTINSEDATDDTWESDDEYVIYLNDVAVGDETTTNVTADADDKTITFKKGASVSYATYSSTFEVLGETYTFTSRSTCSLRFMLDMMQDFYSTYRDRFDYENLELTDDPFWFIISTDPFAIAGLSDLVEQSKIADTLLKKDGDRFTFTPDAARDITITLVKVGKKDIVKIEILGEAEVTGTLQPENIVYINANKIITGEMEVKVLPFVSHVGRLLEDFNPFQYPLVSNDGSFYQVSPGITDVSLGHYHRLLLDKDGSGASTDTLVGDEVVYYGTGTEGESYFIAHAHGVQELNILEASQEGLLEWQNDVTGSNVSSSTHTHNVILPVRGDAKVVYSLKEDENGHLYAGTSDGFIMIPNDPTYLFVLNNRQYYLHGSDLWSLLNEASSLYEKDTDLPFLVTESAYREEITKAEETLLSDGDTVFIYGISVPNRGQDTVMIERVSSFKMPNFGYVDEKRAAEVLDTEVVVGEVVESNASNEIVEEKVVVQRDFSNVPIWSIELKFVTLPTESYISPVDYTDFIVVGGNVVAKNRDIDENIGQTWDNIEMPIFVGIARKIFKASNGDYWLTTNNGLLVSRSYSNGDIFGLVSLPGGNPDIQDITEGANDNVYTASAAGIFKTVDGGKTWTKLLDVVNGFTQIIRDYTLDKSNVVNGHYHMTDINSEGNGFLEESIGTGLRHVHVVNSWTIQETIGHTHTLVTTLYAVDQNKDVWKSLDNGDTWAQDADLPSGECGDVIAAFGSLFVSQYDGLYKYGSATWTKILNAKAYSYNWNYDIDELLIGSDNAIYRTDDGVSFEVAYQFAGYPSPTLFRDQARECFGYAYSNESKVFYFKNMTITDDELTALVDFGTWYAENGGWDADVLYDIYIDYKRVLSTKFNEDKRSSYGYDFDVIPSNGLLDFSATTSLKETIDVYDNIITVEDASDFVVGERVYIDSDLTSDSVEKPNKESFKITVPSATQAAYKKVTGEDLSSQYNVGAYQEALDEYYARIDVINKMSMFAIITAINGDELTISPRASRVIESPGTVYKLPALNSDSFILGNVYQSFLSNISVFTHGEIEDKLSTFSDGRAYKFNDTYLSNLLQLTQATRYVYPDINAYFKNDMFYDFRYKSSSHPDYPEITDFIDVLTSEMYSQQFYDSDFVIRFGKSVNRILIGYGNFSNRVIVATDGGIFWARIQPDYEMNWLYVTTLPFAVYDLLIFTDGTRLIAATGRGTYYTEDLVTWTKELSPAMDYSAYGLALRWEEEEGVVVVPAHDAYFQNDDPSESSSSESSEDDTPPVKNKGYITASIGTPYETLIPNRGIKITNAGDKNGGYIIEEIRDGGDGYGSQMVVSPLFEGSPETRANISIVMGQWWERWDGDENVSNVALTNTLLVGGNNNISFNNGGDVWAWQGSDFAVRIDNFTVREFLSLSTGSILSTSTTYDIANRQNYLLQSNNIGKTWGIFRIFSEIKGNIISSTVSDDNNTLISVAYTYPVDFIYVSGVLDQREIVVLNESSATVFTGRVIGNEVRDGVHYITIYGNSADTVISSGGTHTFRVYPLKVNTMAETDLERIIFGTDQGAYYDADSVITKAKPNGSILSTGIDGTVQQIDVTGKIVSLRTNPLNNNSILSVESDIVIRDGQLVGKYLYITDVDPVEKYEIVDNGSYSVGEETIIEIKATLAQSYKGKKFTAVGDSSRIFINFGLPVFDGQFKDGYLYVTSNENNNLGEEYRIKNNTLTYVDLDGIITPSSTTMASEITLPEGGGGLKGGQDVTLLDSTGRVTLWVSFDKSIKENSLVGLRVTLINSTSPAASVSNITIYSNTEKSIVIDPFTTSDNLPSAVAFTKGDIFDVDGVLFEQLPGFDNRQTSIESDHYHEVETVNDTVSGKVGSFGDTSASFVTINVTDTVNFDDPLVQLQGDLFENAQIIFTNEESYNLRYVSEAISHTATSITVRLKSSSYWNFAEYDVRAISAGWNWQINATNYGYTNGITYKDFAVLSAKITDDIVRDTNTVQVESTVGIVVGDKIKVQDDTLSFEINQVSQIVDATTLRTESDFTRTFFKTRNPQLKVLRGAFSNTHTHQIRNNEVQVLSISSYLEKGYPAEHSHRVLPLVEDITVLLTRSDEIILAGSSSKIYNSDDNGVTWQELSDLNNFIEGGESIKRITAASFIDSGIIAGTATGNVFVQVGG